MAKVLHVLSGVIETELETTLIELIETGMQKHFNFAIHQVRKESPLSPDSKVGPVFGFNQKHLLPYISDPTGELPGAFVLVDGTLVYMKRAEQLERMRDRYLWGYSVNHYYTHASAKELVAELARAHPLAAYEPSGVAEAFLYAPQSITVIARACIKPVASLQLETNL